MANAEHLKILKEGVEVWNKWRKENQHKISILSSAILRGDQLTSDDFCNVDLREIDLSGADLSDADLRGANLNGIKLNEANLNRANLYGATLINAHLYGSSLVEANLEAACFNNADLNSANMRGAYCYRTYLAASKMNNVNLTESRLNDSFLMSTKLNGADLRRADLMCANLIYANLSDVNLSEANLSMANLSNSILDKTILNFTKFSHTTIAQTELISCIGLETIEVKNPCSIDFQTLRASPNLPKSFLLKIGLPELYIDYLPDFFHDGGIKYYPAFLSHSWANKPFARKLYEALIARGVNVFFDEKKMKPGDDIFTSLSRGIELYDKTILVCSEESLNSWWVDQELELVFEKERKLQKEVGEKIGLLIPIRIDDAIDKWGNGKRMAIRQRVVGDFRGWEDDGVFERALDGLVEALKADRKDFPPLSHLPGRGKG